MHSNTINLLENYLDSDSGPVNIIAIRIIEKTLGVKLPSAYVEFITKHNEAYLKNDCFDYFDVNTKRQDTDGITFYDVTEILWIERMVLLNAMEDNAITKHPYFEKGLVPFGGNGGGDNICFDYRNDPMEWPPVVFWSHDVWGDSERVSFIANTFEEFIGMLHKPEELI